jgi:hypothetical protein
LVELVIDTVVCLTVSGQFGGYLKGSPKTIEMTNEN